MRFIATADWQLGMRARPLPEEARARYTESRFEALARIGELARERAAAFIVVCGDVFETNQLDRRVIARTFEALRGADVPVVLVPGNHDPLDSASIYDSPVFAERCPEQVVVAREAEPIRIGDDAEVLPVPWRSKRPGRDLVAEACAGLEPAPAGVVRVIAAHGAVASRNPDATDPATIDDAALADVLARGLADVVVLGDRHSTTEVRPGIWYPGTQEVTARRDVDPGNVLVIDVDPAGDAAAPVAERVRVEPVHVGRWRFVTVEHEFTGDADAEVERLRTRLDALDDKSRTGVWLVLRGTISTSAAARLERLLDEQRDLFALLTVWEHHSDLQVLPDNADFSDLHLTGFAADALDELVAAAGGGGDSGAPGASADTGGLDRPGSRALADDGDRRRAQDALGLLYRLVGGNR
jgi:DNA repair exonuclease SbcCD nuclease subunit